MLAFVLLYDRLIVFVVSVQYGVCIVVLAFVYVLIILTSDSV